MDMCVVDQTGERHIFIGALCSPDIHHHMVLGGGGSVRARKQGSSIHHPQHCGPWSSPGLKPADDLASVVGEAGVCQYRWFVWRMKIRSVLIPLTMNKSSHLGLLHIKLNLTVHILAVVVNALPSMVCIL